MNFVFVFEKYFKILKLNVEIVFAHERIWAGVEIPAIAMSIAARIFNLPTCGLAFLKARIIFQKSIK